MSLRDKLIKNSTLKYTATLDKSKIYTHKDMISTNVPMINVALSGKIDGGMTPGLTMIAGVSKNFKSGFSLLLASAFLTKYPDGMILFYDSEFGTPESYFKQFNIPLDRVIHSPVMTVEELKSDIMTQLNELDRDDKILILVDSIGNLASNKEVTDALDLKVVGDFTRAKALKSLFRMVTPHLSVKDIPMVVVNHTYSEMSMHPRQIVGGGTGATYGSDNIWIVGRQQDKDGTEIKGYHFIINVEKSRYVKEKSKIPITVSYENGINRWSGLFDVALEGKFITKVTAQRYAKTNPSTGEVLSKNFSAASIINNDEFWQEMLTGTKLAEYIENTFSLGHTSENDDFIIEDKMDTDEY
jgi:RecA/RadA recombinase